MKFDNPNLELELAFLHPLVREKVLELDTWSKATGYPEVVVTHILRTLDHQESIYWQSVLKENPGITVATAKSLARKKFSWHLVGCAVDLRNYHYTKQQLANVVAHLKLKTSPVKWLVLPHDVGRGNHIHLDFKDKEWKDKYQASGMPDPHRKNVQ